MLQQVEEGHLKQIEAARRLRLTGRQVRRLQARLSSEGDRAIVHRLRGRRSNRKIPEALTQCALRQLRQALYAGFGPTLAAEHPASQGLEVSRETLRKWMSAAGLWQHHPDAQNLAHRFNRAVRPGGSAVREEGAYAPSAVPIRALPSTLISKSPCRRTVVFAGTRPIRHAAQWFA